MKKIILILFIQIFSFSARKLELKTILELKKDKSTSITAYYLPETESNFKRAYGLGFEKNYNKEKEYVSIYASYEIGGGIRYDVKAYVSADLGYTHNFKGDRYPIKIKGNLGFVYKDIFELEFSTSNQELLNIGVGLRTGI